MSYHRAKWFKKPGVNPGFKQAAQESAATSRQASNANSDGATVSMLLGQLQRTRTQTVRGGVFKLLRVAQGGADPFAEQPNCGACTHTHHGGHELFCTQRLRQPSREEQAVRRKVREFLLQVHTRADQCKKRRLDNAHGHLPVEQIGIAGAHPLPRGIPGPKTNAQVH